MDLKATILLVIIVAAFVYIHFASAKLRNFRCSKCGGKVMVFGTKEEPNNVRARVSSIKLLFTPNSYITQVQCKKCGHIQNFNESKNT